MARPLEQAMMMAYGGLPPPFDGLNPTFAGGISRKLKTAYAGVFYTASAGLMTVLNDQSGFVRDLGAAGSNRPSTAFIGALPAIQFDGVSNVLGSAINMSTFVGLSTGYMIATVKLNNFNLGTPSYNAAPIFCDVSENMGMHFSGTNPNGTFWAEVWSGGLNQTGVPVVLNTPYVCEWRHDAGVLYSRLNGTNEQSTPAGVGAATGTLLMGGRNFTIDGYIIEAATFDTIPTLAQRNALVQNLGHWCGAAV
jgi:hypothetical protein